MNASDDPRFGAAAARLSGVAARLLGWNPDQFWAATPVELATMLYAFADPLGADSPMIDRKALGAMMEAECDG